PRRARGPRAPARRNRQGRGPTAATRRRAHRQAGAGDARPRRSRRLMSQPAAHRAGAGAALAGGGSPGQARATFRTVEARGVSKVDGRERALAALDLRLDPGDALALLGPNGAGKSTLVGILATLVRPTTGSVCFDGARASAAHRGGIGMLAHEPLVYGD